MSTNTATYQNHSLLQRFSALCTAIVQRYLPDPFIFAALLTFAVFIVAIPITQQSPIQMVDAFAGGFWALLTFAMQMALVVVTGHAMASAPVFNPTNSSSSADFAVSNIMGI